MEHDQVKKSPATEERNPCIPFALQIGNTLRRLQLPSATADYLPFPEVLALQKPHPKAARYKWKRTRNVTSSPSFFENRIVSYGKILDVVNPQTALTVV